ncbi:hypothetical protein R6Q57_001653 [Mikania cordata]
MSGRSRGRIPSPGDSSSSRGIGRSRGCIPSPRDSSFSHGIDRGRSECNHGFSGTLARGYAGKRRHNATPPVGYATSHRVDHASTHYVGHAATHAPSHAATNPTSHAAGGLQHTRFEGSEDDEDYEYSDHEDDEDTTTRPSQCDLNVEHPHHDRFHKPFIRRVGKKFANTKTSFSWEPSEEFANRQGFENVLKDRYGDIMLEMRKESANNARANGHFIINGQDNFNIMCDFPPRMVSQDIWNTDDWAKKSERGRDYRMKVDSSGSISRHTGGSVGYDEHRIRLEIKLGKKPTFKQVFLHTHLKKEYKAKYWVGYYDDNPEGMEFCTNQSKEAYESYSIYMVEKYDEDETQHPIDDIDLWERSQGEKKQSFGIGSSDRHFILTGTPSSSIGFTPSNVMFEQSQQEERELRSQIHELQSQIDTQKEQMREEIKKERDQ